MKKFTCILFSFAALTASAQDSISCDCISYDETYPDKKMTSHHVTSSEELLKVPHASETYVNQLSDYTLEEDSQGRASKLIRTHRQDKSIEEISYTYDANNRLISEHIHFEKGVPEGSYAYRDEQILFYYDGNGRRIRKVRKVIYGPAQEAILEECTYTY